MYNKEIISKKKGCIYIKKQHVINEEIKAKQIRLIDENGEQLGVIPTTDALLKASEKQVDLVQIATGDVPVCKLVDYGKFVFELQKKEKELKKKQKTVELKEIRFSPSIGAHDFDTKIKQLVKFIEKENKVKCTVRFRGRQLAHKDIGEKLFLRIQEATKDIASLDGKMKLEGNVLLMTLTPKK